MGNKNNTFTLNSQGAQVFLETDTEAWKSEVYSVSHSQTYIRTINKLSVSSDSFIKYAY